MTFREYFLSYSHTPAVLIAGMLGCCSTCSRSIGTLPLPFPSTVVASSSRETSSGRLYPCHPPSSPASYKLSVVSPSSPAIPIVSCHPLPPYSPSPPTILAILTIHHPRPTGSTERTTHDRPCTMHDARRMLCCAATVVVFSITRRR